MTRYMNDIDLTQRKTELELELKEVNEKIKVIPTVKEIIGTTHNDVKVFVNYSGDTQELNVVFKTTNESDDAWFGGDELDKIYDFGWFVHSVLHEGGKMQLIFHRKDSEYE